MTRRTPLLLTALLINAWLLVASLGSSLPSRDEVRQIPAGLAVVKHGSFAFANDAPPLTRLVSSIPTYFTRTYSFSYDLRETEITFDSSLREREEEFAAYFAAANARKFLGLIRAARALNLGWWLLGAWVIGRWARELHGDAAAAIALALWCLVPNVLAHEQQATPVFPATVAVVLASYVIHRMLMRPSWQGAVGLGLVLGMAQLVDFSALVLYLVWPILALVFRLGSSAVNRSIWWESLGRGLIVVGVSVWVVNTGYMLDGSGQSLGDYDFVSRSLGAGRAPEGYPRGGEPTGNRFRGTRLGRVIIPLPVDYVEGLDRRWHDGEQARGMRASSYPLPVMAAKIPLGIWGLLVMSLLMTIVNRSSRAAWNQELALWLPAVALTLTMIGDPGLISPEQGAGLVAPFGVLIASKTARLIQARNKAGWLALALVGWALGSSLSAYPRFRSYLSAVAGDSDGIQARMRYGPADGGPYLFALRAWLGLHPEVRLDGVAVHDAVGQRVTGIRYPQPPADAAVVSLGDEPSTRRIGPHPGYYALDPEHLRMKRFAYFQSSIPIAQVGSSIFVYRIGEGDADRGAVRPALAYRAFVNSRGTTYHYALFEPPEYRGDRAWPLIVFLHGYGDRGAEGRQYTAVGLPPALESMKNGFGFFVLCPQGHSGAWPAEREDAITAFEEVEAIEKEYRIDPRRIYLTGLSSGGNGVWELADRFPNRWAAIVPVASSGDPEVASRIPGIPCWCFHNSHDAGSPVASPRRMIAALRAAGGAPRYTEYFGLEHNCWDRAYATPELYEWLLGQRLP